ncbi:hypothetical protein [Nocardia wallacei]|uniref:hypothetical protein n=1 Tax=Nocardia wallacei TaxID=480035 RepID=UPI0024590443|nr:hypothetical protein [Nocardia wallacei]
MSIGAGLDEVSLEAIDPGLGEATALFVAPGVTPPPDLPAPWRPIAVSALPQQRCMAALALWNRPFLDLVPRFAAALRDQLADVRVCKLDDVWVLLYVLAPGVGEPYALWAGWDPATFGETEPPLWDALPAPVREFLRTVHAGFSRPDRPGACGLLAPRYLDTFGAYIGEPEGLPWWEEAWGGGEDFIPENRLVPITDDGGTLFRCISPDAPGKMVILYEGDIDPRADFGPELDDVLMQRVGPAELIPTTMDPEIARALGYSTEPRPTSLEVHRAVRVWTGDDGPADG